MRGEIAVDNPVEQVKERLSIVDVVGTRVPLRRAGRNFKGLCPFHPEKTPSFVVFPDKGNFHCFGCGANGDVFTFVTRTENLEFGDALRHLAARAGVELRPRGQPTVEDQRRERLRATNLAAARFFQTALLSDTGAAARAYLERRGVARETVDAFQIGWAPATWDALLRQLGAEGIPTQDLLDAGLVVAREGGGNYDRFRGRVMFPIRDPNGHVTGFGGRGLADEQPKYLNTAETPLFDKGATLYAVDRARGPIRQGDEAVIVEGYLDAAIAHQAGFTNVVASLGTALTEPQVSILKRLTKRIVLALDPDAAGDDATLRGLETIRQAYGRSAVPTPAAGGVIRLEYRLDADVRIASLPEGRDPDELILAEPAEFARLIAESRPIVDFVMATVLDGANLLVAREKTQAVRRVLQVIAEVRDELQVAHYLQLLGRRVGMSETLLAEELRRLRARGATTPSAPPADERPTLTLEDYVLVLLLDYPHQAHKFGEIDPDDIGRPETREALIALRRFIQEKGEVDSAAFRAVVADFLSAYVDDLIAWASELPRLSEAQVEREIDDRLVQLRRHRLRDEIGDLERILRDADEEDDAATRARYTERMRELAAELRALEQIRAEPRNWRDKKNRLGRRGASDRQQRLDLLAGPGATATVAPDAVGQSAGQ